MNTMPQDVDSEHRPSQAVAVHVQACGETPADQLRISLHEGTVTRIGRATNNGSAIPWDVSISREHADMCWRNGRLQVICLPTARNPIIYQQERNREVYVPAGDVFRIGTTTFTITKITPPFDALKVETEANNGSELCVDDQGLCSYTADDLRGVGFRHAQQQLEYLSQLPELISESQSDAELGQTLCKLLMDAIPHAEAVAVAHYDPDQLPELEDLEYDFPAPVMLRVQTRDDFLSAFRPSRSIIVKALRTRQSVLHVWDSEAPADNFTVSEGLGWAVCAPIRADYCAGWCMYVSGKGSRQGGLYVSRDELAADLRFTELVAQFIGSVRHVRTLQEERSKLSSFFSPKVIDGLTASSGNGVLAPAERDVTVLFCDVRGFSRKAELLQDDLLSLLSSVRTALGIMVDSILERDGSIADFQGDAAMGFWGWPVALEYGPIEACRAAIAIQKEFQLQSSQPGSLLEGFSVGIGIAHGRAIAGQIGTQNQSKIGVFGPVVNQCARLESMTKQFGVSICIDSATADFVDRYFSEDEGRIRPLGRVRPQGMQAAIDVYNLLPPEDAFSEVDRAAILKQEQAHQAILDGRWEDACAALAHIPDADGPKQFLTQRLQTLNKIPPEEWDGVLALTSK